MRGYVSVTLLVGYGQKAFQFFYEIEGILVRKGALP